MVKIKEKVSNREQFGREKYVLLFLRGELLGSVADELR